MEAVILIGLQAAGKTTFYHQRFGTTHLRISLDQLKTRAREVAALLSAIDARLNVVIDNTNPAVSDRARYIAPARAAGYTISGFYFEPDIQGSLKRNASRSGKEQIPAPGIFGTRKRLQLPSLAEGFDALWCVRIAPNGRFLVRPWNDSPGGE